MIHPILILARPRLKPIAQETKKLGKAHLTIHSDSRIRPVVGRCSGLNESIGRSMSKIALLSLASKAGIPSSVRGYCTLSSNRSSSCRIRSSSSRLTGPPSSVKYFPRASHFVHHSGGKGPRASTCSRVMLSCVAKRLSNSSR